MLKKILNFLRICILKLSEPRFINLKIVKLKGSKRSTPLFPVRYYLIYYKNFLIRKKKYSHWRGFILEVERLKKRNNVVFFLTNEDREEY